uniref:Putative Glra4a protein 175 n=1 Tax=Schistosoma japonicum TaxID=6182 RepID=C7TYG3_SCHJA|nr:putative Glra4a protein 175 [Schistosoma japonicum]
MSGNYTSSSNQWIRNKTLIVPENHNSSTLPYNLRENVNYEPISNYNTLINSKSLDSSQNRHRSPCYMKQSPSLIQKQDTLITDMSRVILTTQIPKSIRKYQPMNEVYSFSKRSYSLLHNQSKLEKEVCPDKVSHSYYKDNHKLTLQQSNLYNHIQLKQPPLETNLPMNKLNISQDYQNRFHLNPNLLPYRMIKPPIHQIRPSFNLVQSKRTRSPEILQNYVINTKQMNRRRTPSPLKFNLIENNEPDIWNIGSAFEYDQSVYLTDSKFKMPITSISSQFNKSKQHINNVNINNCECHSQLSTDDETVSLNTIDSEENRHLLNRHSYSLQKININKYEFNDSTKTLIPLKKSSTRINQAYHHPFSSSCKSVHWNKIHNNPLNKKSIPSDRQIEKILPLNNQLNNTIMNCTELSQLPLTSSIIDQPTTLTKTYGDESGDKWTVYYRNPNIPNVCIEPSSTILDISKLKHSPLQYTSCKLPTNYSNELHSRKNHQMLTSYPNDIETISHGNNKNKHKKHQIISIKQTEKLIHALESLKDSIEKTNYNLELELNEINHFMKYNQNRSFYTQDNDVISHRTSTLTGRIRSRSTNTKYNNRYEHKRKSFTLKHSDEYNNQNRNEKVAVEVRVVFLKIGEIDTLKELYYADAFLQAKWREPKLDGHTAEELSITELEQYWNPLLYIDNILSETKDTQWIMAVRSENGEVYLMERRRIKGVFLETLELNDFPLDVQDLTITVTTERPDTEVDIIPDQVEMSAINIQTFVDQQEWKLHEHVEIKKRIIKQEYSSSMKSHPCLSVTCRAARRPGYFYWNVFLIMFMISGLAFATFAVSPDKAELRLRLSFTLILTSVTFKYVITQSLPKISYLTYMDKYVLMSLFILCIISIWHAVVTLIGLDFDLPDPPGFTSPLPSTTSNNGAFISPTENVNNKYHSPRLIFPEYNNTSSSSSSSSSSRQSVPDQSYSTFHENISSNNVLNSSQTSGKMNTSLHNLSSISPTLSMYSNQHQNDSNLSFIKTTSTPPLPPTTTTSNQTLNSLLKEQINGCSRANRMACSDWKMVQQIEQHVFTSFVTIYILAHAIFIFWLYFDASRRRREMRQKDKDYRATKRPINQYEFGSGTSL